MAQKVTSLADFFRKAEAGLEYQNAAVRAYEGVFDGEYNWPMVKDKLDKWAAGNVGGQGGDQDCSRMVDYLNLFIEDPMHER